MSSKGVGGLGGVLWGAYSCSLHAVLVRPLGTRPREDGVGRGSWQPFRCTPAGTCVAGDCLSHDPINKVESFACSSSTPAGQSYAGIKYMQEVSNSSWVAAYLW